MDDRIRLCLFLSPAQRACREQLLHRPEYEHGFQHGTHCKQAADPQTVHALSGRLYLSKSGWGMLSVPNAVVRGLFDALDEPGVELPHRSNGSLTAHISVFRPEDIEAIGGPDKLKERGKTFRYTLGPMQSVKPRGWSEMSRVWFVKVNSPELKQLRRSYGLSSLPRDGKHEFHITVAVRKKKVLQDNLLRKAASYLEATC